MSTHSIDHGDARASKRCTILSMLRVTSLAMVLLFTTVSACKPEAPAAPTSTGPATSSSGAAAASTDAAAGHPGRRSLFVRETKADCEGGEGPRRCLQVRDSPTAEWRYFYGTIRGFQFEEGTRYELEVHAETIGDAPEDSTAVRYTLVKIVSHERVASP